MSRNQQLQQEPDDPLNPKFAASTLDFLLIELVPLAQRITEQLHAREQALLEEYKRSRIFNRGKRASVAAEKTPQVNTVEHGASVTAVATDGSVKSSVSDSAGAQSTFGGMTCLGFPVMDERTREGVFWRLDGLGYRVGQGLVER